jgi:hypothetical protein
MPLRPGRCFPMRANKEGSYAQGLSMPALPIPMGSRTFITKSGQEPYTVQIRGDDSRIHQTETTRLSGSRR